MRKVDVFRFFVDTQNDNYGDTVKRRIPTLYIIHHKSHMNPEEKQKLSGG